MNGTETLIAVLSLGFGVLVVILVLMLAALRLRRSGEVEFSIAEIFSAKLTLPAEEKAKAVDAIRAAAESKGSSPAAAADELRSRVSSLDQVTIKRALWVDDEPDNNVYETLTLTRLGVFVTNTTSNDAARLYLARIHFDLVITDLGREGTTDNGFVLVDELHTTRPQLPIVVYTANADRYRAELQGAGACAVADQPAPLIDAVLAAI